MAVQRAAGSLEEVQTSARDLSAHLALGGLYSDHLKDPDKASVHFRKVLELSPQHPQATGIRQWLFNHSQR